MYRQKLLRRVRSLRNMEALNIFFLPACIWFILARFQVQNWQPYAFAMFMICVILAQGVLYWHWKLQAIQHGKCMPDAFCRLFSFFKWGNVALLILFPAAALLGSMLPGVNFQMSVGAGLIYLFAILEYVNYYHYQLSHDNWNDLRYLLKHRRLRRSHLYMDMHRKEISIKSPR